MSKPVVPEEPLTFIQRCVREQRIYWTYHVNMRMVNRFISRKAILDAVQTFEIIESYPKDKYLPSYLVFAKSSDGLFHILFAIDVENDNVRIVTVYRPSPEEWQPDMKTRRALT